MQSDSVEPPHRLTLLIRRGRVKRLSTVGLDRKTHKMQALTLRDSPPSVKPRKAETLRNTNAVHEKTSDLVRR